MFDKLKDLINRWLIKDLFEMKYTKYKVNVICNNAEDNFSFIYNNYSMWDKEQLVEMEITYKKNVIDGIPIANIRKFEIEELDSIIVYKEPLMSDFTGRFMTKEEIEEFNNRKKKKILLYKKYKNELNKNQSV